MTDFTANLNLPIPEEGNTNWRALEASVKEAIDDVGNLFAVVIPAPFLAELNQVFYDGLVFQEDVTVKKISLYAVTAPTGADLKVDLLKDGVPQARTATLTLATNFALTDIVDLDYLAGNRLGLKFTQVGSVEEGNGVSATIYYQKKAIP